MIITNYYRGSTDRLSGFVFDTDKKTYKEFVIPGKIWTEDKGDKICTKDGFDPPGDLQYYFRTLTEMQWKLDDVRKMGFKEDKNMILDFGIFTM